MAFGRNKSVEEKEYSVHDLITEQTVDEIRRGLIEEYPDLVVQGMLDKNVRKELDKVVRRQYRDQTGGNEDVITYVVRETIGTGVIEEILEKDTSVTDIGYNGSELIIESNDSKIVYDSDQPITDDYIVRLVSKFANANNKEFTSKSPIFDGRFDNVRINAVHSQNTAPESGTTMSLRVVRPRLALTKDNFEGFAPLFMLDFFETLALTKSNMVISGTTGTGKTELHKLISGFIPFNDRIILIEDTPETFMKQMFPEKDIYSWVTSEEVGVTAMIKAGLRNHPVWMMVTETRGSEAYEMIQAVLSGQSIMTSLHTANARAIPSRLVNMAKMGYTLDEHAMLDDIRRYFDFGIHIKKLRYNGRVIRYLSEVVAFDPNGDKTVFKQRFVDDVFHYETYELPQSLLDVMEELGLTLDFPSNLKNKRAVDLKSASFETVIPVDKTGRPDMKRIEAMGTTLDALMGRAAKPFDPAEAAKRRPDSVQTDEQGFIRPNLGGGEKPVPSATDAQMAAAKQRLDTPRPPRRRETPDTRPDVQHILKEIGIQKPKPQAPKRPVTQKPPEKTAEEIMREKRARLQQEDV